MKRSVKLLLWLALIFIVWMWWSTRSVGLKQEPVTIVIESGDSLTSVSEMLEENNVIRSSFAFKLLGRFTGAARSLKTGAYVFTGEESVGDILDIIEDGRIQVKRVTIPEGLTIVQIDRLLASKGLGQPGDIIDCAFTCDFRSFDFVPTHNMGNPDDGYGSKLEGYVFPETYSISAEGYVPKFFLEQMLGEFRRRVIQKYEKEIRESERSLHEIVVMASLVEEESRKDEERAVVAGILWKRLDNAVVLGVDATTRYQLGKMTEPLTKKDLESSHSYNTRRTLGLPPGPIANPSEASIVATLRPTTSRYWYYLHDRTGAIHYAETNDEHNLNKARYLR